MSKKIKTIDHENLFDQFSSVIEENLSTGSSDLNIIEFVEQEVDLGIELTVQQITVLKCFYNLELTEEEESIVQYWTSLGKSTWSPDDTYQSLILESGRRSGKTSIAALITAYEYYQLCNLPSPQRHYKIATSTPISILVLATTATQAKKTIFKTVTGVVNNTKYFKKLLAQGKMFVGTEEIKYDDKLLYIYSGNSQSGSQVGGTMKALVMDEVARFKDSDGESNALELWSNLGIATVTFGKEARRVAISSAWFEDDAIAQMYETTKTDPTSLGLRTVSWDLNPIHASRDNPMIASEYAANADKAALEFEGIRPTVENAFLDIEEIKAAFTGKTCLTFTPYQEEENGYCLEKLTIDTCEFRKSGTVLHIDPAIVTDSYAMATGHSEFNKDGKQIVVISSLLSWEPKHNSQVSITDVQKAILHIHKYRPLSKITADHYNSAETIQRLRSFGINAEVQHYSNKLQVAMYDLVRMLLHEGRLVLPNNSPLSLKLRKELSQVQLIRGSKIDHPSQHGSKDLSDAVASICYVLAERINRDRVHQKGITTTSFNTFKVNERRELVVGGRQYTDVGSSAKQRVLNNQSGVNKWLNRQY